MGYYLPPKSYLRPKPRVNATQKIIAITTVSITVIAAVVIFITLHFTDNRSAIAAENENQVENDFVSIPLQNPRIDEVPKSKVVDYVFPVQLAYFKIVREDIKTVQLKWSTTFEYQNQFFTVEKSINGTDFMNVGCVESAQNEKLSNDYIFNDAIDGNENIFYRLRQTSINQRSTYIALEKISLNNINADMSLYIENIGPQPFDKYFSINYYTVRDGGVSVEVFDKSGKRIYKTYTDAEQGFNTCRFIDGEKLTDEIYTVRIANSVAADVKRIRKKV
jgi:hypothetical protein